LGGGRLDSNFPKSAIKGKTIFKYSIGDVKKRNILWAELMLQKGLPKIVIDKS
jgi:hypothetical protein